MRCAEVERLLPEYLDEMLPISQRRSVEDHLEACAACEQELAGHRRALIRLERVSLGPAPDLWAAFSQRMAAEITCREVRESLPAYQDGALAAALSLSVHSHLKGCSECAVEAEKLAACLDTLERVGEEVPQVDLWAAFVERREAEARRPVGLLSRLSAAFRTAWQSPGFQPALGLGVLALCVVSGRHLLQATQTDSPSYSVAVEKPVEVAANLPTPREIEVRQPSTSAAEASTPAPSPRRREQTPRARRTALASAARPATGAHSRPQGAHSRAQPAHSRRQPHTPGVRPGETLVAAVDAPAKGVWTSQLQVSYNMPDGAAVSGTPAADTPVAPAAPAPKEGDLFKKAVVVNSGRAQAEVMPEVVEAVRLLAGIEDATRNPFGAEADAH